MERFDFNTLISTSSKTMQLISLTPAPTRTFAERDTLGPICGQKWHTLEVLGRNVTQGSLNPESQKSATTNKDRTSYTYSQRRVELP